MHAQATNSATRGIDAALAVVSAAVIAYGVLVLGWSVFTVMALFWFENVVIGGFNVVRMLVSGVRQGLGGFVGAVFTAAFFTVHYGLFTAVHGVFVVMLFGMPELGRDAMSGGLAGPLYALAERLLQGGGAIALLAIVAVHAVSLVQWLVATRERPAPLNELMAAPYGRIVVLHITLIAGGFLVMSLKAPEAGVLLLVALKLAYDLIGLRRAARSAPDEEAQERVRRLLVFGRRKLR